MFSYFLCSVVKCQIQTQARCLCIVSIECCLNIVYLSLCICIWFCMFYFLLITGWLPLPQSKLFLKKKTILKRLTVYKLNTWHVNEVNHTNVFSQWRFLGRRDNQGTKAGHVLSFNTYLKSYMNIDQYANKCC